MTSYCPRCGATVPAGSRLCTACGRTVEDREATGPAGSPAPADPRAHPPTAPGHVPTAGPTPPSEMPTTTSAHPPTLPGHAPPAPLPPAGGTGSPDAYDPYDHHILRPAPLDPSASSPQLPHPAVWSPAAPRRRGSALVWAATLTGALLIGGGGAAGLLLWEDRGGTGNTAVDTPRSDPSGTSAESGPAGPATPVPSPSPTTGEPDRMPSPRLPTGETYTGGGVPDGYHRVADPMGFSFAVPDGWSREGVKRGTQVMYGGPTGVERLQVGVIANAGYTSYENFVNLERTARRVNDGYRRIRLEPNTFQGREGAVWEYTYVDDAGRTIRALDQGYVAGNGTEYAIFAVGREDAWAEGFRQTHQVALDTWRLT